jgi:hypothetical protein
VDSPPDVRVLVVLAALLGATLAPAANAKSTIVRFQTPSKNIGCIYSAEPNRRAYLRCDILSGLRPEPKRPCPVDWTGFSMTARSRATPTCAGDTAYDRGAPTVAYGRTWRRGGFTCTVRRVGLRCRNATAHGFFLSRTRSYAF